MPWYVATLRALTEFLAPTQTVKTVRRGEEEKVIPVNRFNETTILVDRGGKRVWERVFYIRGKPFIGSVNYFVGYTREGEEYKQFWDRFKENLEAVLGAFFSPENVERDKEFHVKPGKSIKADCLCEGAIALLFFKTKEALTGEELETLKTLFNMAFTEVGVGKRKKYGFGRFLVLDIKEGYNPWTGQG